MWSSQLLRKYLFPFPNTESSSETRDDSEAKNKPQWHSDSRFSLREAAFCSLFPDLVAVFCGSLLQKNFIFYCLQSRLKGRQIKPIYSKKKETWDTNSFHGRHRTPGLDSSFDIKICPADLSNTVLFHSYTLPAPDLIAVFGFNLNNMKTNQGIKPFHLKHQTYPWRMA